MAYDVKFRKGTIAGFNALDTKDDSTLYFVTDQPSIYLGSLKLTSVQELEAALTRVGANEDGVNDIKKALKGIDLTEGSVLNAIKKVDVGVGSLDDLTTSDKSSVVGAINEVKKSVSDLASSSSVTLIKEQSATEGYSSTYTIKQGEHVVGQIDIIKDKVVKSGEIVTATVENPIRGKTSGEFIKLVLENVDEPLYIDAAKLVDVYRAGNGISINANNEISVVNKTDREVIGTNGKSLIFNESDGGGAKFEHKDNTFSYVGVNDGGASGITGQLYSIDHANGNLGTRMNMTSNGFYYTKGKTSAAYTADDEIATKGDIVAASLVWGDI